MYFVFGEIFVNSFANVFINTLKTLSQKTIKHFIPISLYSIPKPIEGTQSLVILLYGHLWSKYMCFIAKCLFKPSFLNFFYQSISKVMWGLQESDCIRFKIYFTVKLLVISFSSHNSIFSILPLWHFCHFDKIIFLLFLTFFAILSFFPYHCLYHFCRQDMLFALCTTKKSA